MLRSYRLHDPSPLLWRSRVGHRYSVKSDSRASARRRNGWIAMAIAKSKKTEAIEILFARFWPEGQEEPIVKPMVATNADVVAAINARNASNLGKGKLLSPNNPANFLKDLIRKPTCNTNWPLRLRNMRITARQRYGEGQVLEFVDYRAGDEVPFPDRYDPIEGMVTIRVEALSLPRAARALGRVDEAWLTQVVVYQRIIHHHLGVVSKKNVVDLTHLQMSVKTQPEIDAIFVATVEDKGKDIRLLVTCEAKQYGERILEDQIREQVAQAFATTKKVADAGRIDAVLPIVVKVVKYDVPQLGATRGVYVAEFDMMDRESFEKAFSKSLHDMPLTITSRAFYHFQPPVRGISDNTNVVPVTARKSNDKEE